jgi:hypothetical protein
LVSLGDEAAYESCSANAAAAAEATVKAAAEAPAAPASAAPPPPLPPLPPLPPKPPKPLKPWQIAQAQADARRAATKAAAEAAAEAAAAQAAARASLSNGDESGLSRQGGKEDSAARAGVRAPLNYAKAFPKLPRKLTSALLSVEALETAAKAKGCTAAEAAELVGIELEELHEEIRAIEEMPATRGRKNEVAG